MRMGESELSSALSGLGYHYGTGTLLAAFAAYALGSLGASASRRAPGVGEDDRADSHTHTPGHPSSAAPAPEAEEFHVSAMSSRLDVKGTKQRVMLLPVWSAAQSAFRLASAGPA